MGIFGGASRVRGCDAHFLPLVTRDFVAEWIHFTLFGIILPTIKQKV